MLELMVPSLTAMMASNMDSFDHDFNFLGLFEGETFSFLFLQILVAASAFLVLAGMSSRLAKLKTNAE